MARLTCRRGRTLLARASIALIALAWGHNALAANNYPLVLVYGYLGFAPGQLYDKRFKYWGGYNDIVGHLQGLNGGHQVFASVVGPVSSNWDRAAELYYQIKGGCVDYGRYHTARHAQFGALQKPAGKCWAADPNNNPQKYPLALYPAWDARHPIHLLGHSQGGQTIRALIELLEHGSPDGDEGGAALYAGGKVGWVVSATTISAPHNGTTMRDAMLDFAPKTFELAGKIAGMAQMNSRDPVYKFGLEQFGLTQSPTESLWDFQQRVKDAPFWQRSNRDSAQWEMAPDGAREFNSWVKTSPNVYYYSIGTVATEAGSYCCNQTDRFIAPFQNSRYQYPRSDMNYFTRSTAGEWIVPSLFRRGMGSYTQSDPNRVPIDSTWFPNDGMVNTVSMRAPSGHPLRIYDGTSVRGTWNFLTDYRPYDHFDVIGWTLKGPSAYPIYEKIADIIYGL